MSDNDLVSKWTELKDLIQGLDLDVHKNAAGNAAAGVRARKGLRHLKKVASVLVKQSVAGDKAKKSTKAPRAAKSASAK